MIGRRGFVLGGAALAVLAAAPRAAAAPADPLADQLARRIADVEREHGALVGLYATNLDSDRVVAHRADEPSAMCSTFKAYAAARVLQLDAAGRLRLDDRVPITADDILPNSPVTETRVDDTMTIGELCAAALQRSDNAAANGLLRIIGGPSRITEFARGIGDDRTRLDRWEVELNTAIPGDPRDTSSPRALGSGYVRILTGDVLAPPQRNQLDAWMRANQTSSMRAGLPDGWTSADKTGAGDYATANDVGIAYGPGGERLLLAVMLRTAAGGPDAPTLRPVVGELTAAVVPYLLGRDG